MTTTPSPTRATGPTTAIASEWTKLWSVRSTWWSLVGALVLVLLMALSMGLDASYPPEGVPRAEAMLAVQDASALGMTLAQFALITLATLTVTSEFATGSMLSTLQWDPRRGRVLLAKLAVVAPVVFVAATGMMFVGALVADLSAGDYGHLVVSEVMETSLRTGVYVALAAVIASGIGCVLRSAAGTLTAIFLLLMLLPMILGQLDIPVVSTVGEFLPGAAGMHFASSAAMIELGELPYSPAEGLIILIGWAVGAAALGHVALRRRDV